MYIYIYIYVCIYICIYIYVYIETERKREGEREREIEGLPDCFINAEGGFLRLLGLWGFERELQAPF